MYIVLPLALLFAAIAVGAFIWAVRGGQLDDLETPAARMLLDDDDHPAGKATTQPSEKQPDEPAAAETASHEARKRE